MSDWSEEKWIAFDKDDVVSLENWEIASLRLVGGSLFPEFIYDEIRNHRGEICCKGKTNYKTSYEEWLKKHYGESDYDRNLYLDILGWRNIYEKY